MVLILCQQWQTSSTCAFYFSSALQNETCYTSDDCYDSASDCVSSRCQCAAGYEYNKVLLHCTGEALSESTWWWQTFAALIRVTSNWSVWEVLIDWEETLIPDNDTLELGCSTVVQIVYMAKWVYTLQYILSVTTCALFNKTTFFVCRCRWLWRQPVYQWRYMCGSCG